MKKETSFPGAALPEHLVELIDLSGVDGPFRDFIESYVFSAQSLFPHNQFLQEELLKALNEAKSVHGENTTETITLQFISLVNALELPIDHFYVQPTIKRIGELYWKDRALELYNFLVKQASYPAIHWCSILFNHENIQAKPFEPSTVDPKTLEAQIIEGLIRHCYVPQDPCSPYSINYWFNIELWRTEPPRPECAPNENEGPFTPPWESAQYLNNKKIFNAVLVAWSQHMLKIDNENAIYDFFDWTENQNINDRAEHDQLEKAQVESIWEAVQKRPISAPHYPLSLKDIPQAIRALGRRKWLSGNKSIKPTEDALRYLQEQLKAIAELCATDRLKARIPQDTIRDLIPVFDWVPVDYVRNYAQSEDAQDAIAIKLFALMRNRIQHEKPAFKVYDYRYSIQLLVHRQKETAVLRQLLMTLRVCPGACSDESLNFRKKLDRIHYIKPINFDGVSPEYCVSYLIDLLIGSFQIKDRRRELCLDLADYLMSRLKFRKQKGRSPKPGKFDGLYDDSKCVESNPIWRKAYAEALGELGYALDGKVLHLLDFVRKHDPAESVRDAAHSSYRLIHREQTKDFDDYKSLRAAFWALRKAQREALDLPVDEAQSKLLRRQELRNERQTNPSYIYIGYLDLH